jgi:hypothetical protein
VKRKTKREDMMVAILAVCSMGGGGALEPVNALESKHESQQAVHITTCKKRPVQYFHVSESLNHRLESP